MALDLNQCKHLESISVFVLSYRIDWGITQHKINTLFYINMQNTSGYHFCCSKTQQVGFPRFFFFFSHLFFYSWIESRRNCFWNERVSIENLIQTYSFYLTGVVNLQNWAILKLTATFYWPIVFSFAHLEAYKRLETATELKLFSVLVICQEDRCLPLHSLELCNNKEELFINVKHSQTL